MKNICKILILGLFFVFVPTKVFATALPVPVPVKYLASYDNLDTAFCLTNPTHRTCGTYDTPVLIPTVSCDYCSPPTFYGYSLLMCQSAYREDYGQATVILHSLFRSPYQWLELAVSDGHYNADGVKIYMACRVKAQYTTSDQKWRTDSFNGRHMPDRRYSVVDSFFSGLPVYFAQSVASPDWNGSYGWPDTVPIPLQLFNKNWDLQSSSTTPPPHTYPFRLDFYTLSHPSPKFLTLESQNRCSVDLENGSNNFYPIVCNGLKSLFQTDASIPITTVYDEGLQALSLYIPDLDYPCSHIRLSNYNILDTYGNPLCPASINPVVQDMIDDLPPVIGFTPENYDWGAFNFLLTPAKSFFDAIDSALLWVYNTWAKFLHLIIPDNEGISFQILLLKSKAQEKFGNIDISSLNDFGEVVESDLPTITTTIMGTQVNIIDFSLIKPHMGIIRAILIASVGMFLILFNVNQVNKLLADEEITTV